MNNTVVYDLILEYFGYKFCILLRKEAKELIHMNQYRKNYEVREFLKL